MHFLFLLITSARFVIYSARYSPVPSAAILGRDKNSPSSLALRWTAGRGMYRRYLACGW